ncbi:tryptophan synthase subunit alpha [Carboxylicivirga caseinilyticus]|uniref:tryptophan synthase subunit alpha n=1 Tax=Carboxylicivirga caseinilyticus TaxID=3417572 RepID=UPI003D33AEB2|nr:tryptophan synthase subunit alpha [Marinilabiliaceae bacterium A049]
MNRIQKLLQEKKKIFSAYYTAGHPQLEDTLPILEALQEAGTDLVEVGMPFSDPLADGPTIQKSSEEALENGMSIKKLFEQIKEMRKTIDMPIVLMGYFNPVFKYGVEAFVAKCKEVGVDGVILPDLPFDEYKDKYQQLFEDANISNIFLITPQTPDERIKLIDANSNGFIYMVSSAAVTGAKSGLSDQQLTYFNRVNNLGLKTPRIIGFGISNKETFTTACQYASGAIVGSAFVKLLAEKGADKTAINDFVKSIKDTSE